MNARTRRLSPAERLRHTEILTACRAAEQGRPADGPSLAQLRVLDTLRSLAVALGVPPTQSEIAVALGFSTGTVAAHLLRLEAQGFVRRTGGTRGLELTDKPFGAPCGHCAGSGRQS